MAPVPVPNPPADDAPHLLVVDDDRRIRDLLSRFLSTEGYRISTADSAAMARAKLASLSFDLLILDVMMPGETGFEFARHIRQTSAVPILMLTARDAAESRITGLEIGADDYVSKPFEPRELSLRIASILRRAKPAAAPAAEIAALRRVRVSYRAGRAAPRRRRRPAHRPRARDADRARRRARRDRAAHGARRLRRLGQRARGRRAGQPAAPQDRARPDQSADRADRARHRLPAGGCRHDHARPRHRAPALGGRRGSPTAGAASTSGTRRCCRRASTPARC